MSRALKSDRSFADPKVDLARPAPKVRKIRNRHGLFIDKHPLSQKRMNRFQKVEKIKAAPSDDLGFPEGPQIQNILSFHD